MKGVVALALIVAPCAVCQDLYVAGFTAKKIYKVAAGSGPTTSIALPASPLDIVLTADGRFLYASHPLGNSVSIVRTSDGVPITTLPAGTSPRKMAIGNDDTRLYIANQTQSPPHVTIMDIRRQGADRQNAIIGAIDLRADGAHSAYAVAAVGCWLAVGTHSGHLLLYDTSGVKPQLLAKRKIGSRIMHVEFSPLQTKLYALLATPASGVSESGAGTAGNLHVLRVPSLDLKTAMSAGPAELTAAAVVDLAHLYATDVRGSVHVVDIGTDTVKTSIQAGRQLTGVRAADGLVYLADAGGDAIRTVISSRACLAGSVSLDRHAVPVGMAVSPHVRLARAGPPPARVIAGCR